MYRKFLVIFLIVIFSFSCKNVTNNTNSTNVKNSIAQKSQTKDSLPDISGVYNLPDGGCKLALTIKKEKNVFRYNFTGDQLDLEGTSIVSKLNEDIYITFDGPIGNTPPKTVEALYKDNTLTIQNDGNAQNNYHYFDCDEKYLEFKKK